MPQRKLVYSPPRGSLCCEHRPGQHAILSDRRPESWTARQTWSRARYPRCACSCARENMRTLSAPCPRLSFPGRRQSTNNRDGNSRKGLDMETKPLFRWLRCFGPAWHRVHLKATYPTCNHGLCPQPQAHLVMLDLCLVVTRFLASQQWSFYFQST